MPLSKPLVLEPLGLILDASKLGQYPDGAMLIDVGIVHVGAGSHEAAPKFEDVQVIPAAGCTAVEVIPTPGYTLVLAKFPAGWRYSWIDDLGVASAWTAATHAYAPLPAGADFEIDGRVSYIIARDRVFVTTTTGPMVFDYLRPQNATERAPRIAGMFAPAIIASPVTGPDASAIKDGEQAHVVAVITRHFPDCYEVTGPPSAAVQVAAVNLDVNVQVQVLQRPGHPQYIAGDMIEVYRTYQTHRPKNEGAPEDYDQGTSTTSQYFLSSVFTCPNSDNAHTWIEATGDQNLGEALYTNDPVVGASSQKRPPPIARVIEEFRGYTFYFDITEPPARVARAQAGMGELTDAYSQEWGIGTRPGPAYDSVEIDGQSFTLADADDLASCVLCNVDDLARVNPDTPGEKTTPASGFAFRFDYAGYGDFTIRASNGQNYQPPLPTLSEDAELVTRPRRKNGMMWTENGQPEAVVAAGLVGKGQVYGACATSQAMVIWTEYGIHRLSGTGGSSSAGFDWALDQIDTQVLLRGPKAYGKLGDVTFCASNNGAITIDAGGMVREISTAALGDIGRNPLDADGKRPFRETDKTRVIPDEGTGDVYFCFDGDAYPYVYSTRWNKWSRVRVATDEVIAAAGNLQQDILFAEVVADDLIIRSKSPTLHQESIVRFQPVFDGDPSTLKDFTEIEWYFHGDCAGAPVTFLVNEMESIERDLDGIDATDTPSYIQSTIAADVQNVDGEYFLAQTWMEVPKDAPRVCNGIVVGYYTPESECAYRFFGLSITCIHSSSTIRRAKGST